MSHSGAEGKTADEASVATKLIAAVGLVKKGVILFGMGV